MAAVRSYEIEETRVVRVYATNHVEAVELANAAFANQYNIDEGIVHLVVLNVREDS